MEYNVEVWMLFNENVWGVLWHVLKHLHYIFHLFLLFTIKLILQERTASCSFHASYFIKQKLNFKGKVDAKNVLICKDPKSAQSCQQTSPSHFLAYSIVLSLSQKESSSHSAFGKRFTNLMVIDFQLMVFCKPEHQRHDWTQKCFFFLFHKLFPSYTGHIQIQATYKYRQIYTTLYPEFVICLMQTNK